MTQSDETISAELAPVEPEAVTLFQTSSPRLALERMAELAKLLVDLVRSQGLAVRIRGAEHLRVEAWRAMAAMTGIYAMTAWTKPNESGDGYLARVEVRTRAGELVGAAEAECSRAERQWANRDAHALRAMAETRATSRALRGPLGPIVVLAEYSTSLPEELDGDEPTTREQPRPLTGPVGATRAQLDKIGALIRSLEARQPGADWKQRARDLAGVPGTHLTCRGAAVLIEKLLEELGDLAGGENDDGVAA
jgi:hypothetical protein